MFRLISRKSPAQGALRLDGIDTVLFDLDGTLVDVDMQRFVPAYLQRLTSRLSEHGDPRRIAGVMRRAVGEMLSCDTGECTMEALLLERLTAECGITADQYRRGLRRFVTDDLPEFAPLVKAHPLAGDLLQACLDQGWRPALATNPIFPRAVVDARLAWGGLDHVPFHAVTAYETARFCKPQPGYFRELTAALDVNAEACLMVGNDTEHDLAAGRVGLQTCLLTTWRIDRMRGRYAADWEGSHEELLTLLRGQA